MSSYEELKIRHQKEVDEFPMAFAFTKEQFADGMRKLGLNPEDTEAVRALPGGGFCRVADVKRLNEMFERHAEERQAAIKNDVTGDGYIYDMFYNELGNHEYNYTGDISDTLAAVGLSMDEINQDEKLLHGLNKAVKGQREYESYE